MVYVFNDLICIFSEELLEYYTINLITDIFLFKIFGRGGWKFSPVGVGGYDPKSTIPLVTNRVFTFY